jgi:hypothetical protein
MNLRTENLNDETLNTNDDIKKTSSSTHFKFRFSIPNSPSSISQGGKWISTIDGKFFRLSIFFGKQTSAIITARSQDRFQKDILRIQQSAYIRECDIFSRRSPVFFLEGCTRGGAGERHGASNHSKACSGRSAEFSIETRLEK